MVGVGINGEESSLARVSLVNVYGVVILDEFVRQKERVVDYRTQWSGIRETDMIHGKYSHYQFTVHPDGMLLLFQRNLLRRYRSKWPIYSRAKF